MCRILFRLAFLVETNAVAVKSTLLDSARPVSHVVMSTMDWSRHRRAASAKVRR